MFKVEVYLNGVYEATEHFDSKPAALRFVEAFQCKKFKCIPLFYTEQVDKDCRILIR